MGSLKNRSVVLRGHPKFNEQGYCTAQVNPGYLVKGSAIEGGVVAHQTANAQTKIPAAFAVERDELGTGIDATYATTASGTGNYYYSSGDTVKVAVCDAGTQVSAFIASGQSIAADDLLVSNGDGTLAKIGVYASGVGPSFPVARALDTTGGAVSVATILRVEIL